HARDASDRRRCSLRASAALSQHRDSESIPESTRALPDRQRPTLRAELRAVPEADKPVPAESAIERCAWSLRLFLCRRVGGQGESERARGGAVLAAPTRGREFDQCPERSNAACLRRAPSA